jgi:hypothetical protein
VTDLRLYLSFREALSRLVLGAPSLSRLFSLFLALASRSCSSLDNFFIFLRFLASLSAAAASLLLLDWVPLTSQLRFLIICIMCSSRVMSFFEERTWWYEWSSNAAVRDLSWHTGSGAIMWLLRPKQIAHQKLGRMQSHLTVDSLAALVEVRWRPRVPRMRLRRSVLTGRVRQAVNVSSFLLAAASNSSGLMAIGANSLMMIFLPVESRRL